MELNFPQIEKKILKFWEENKIFEKLRKKNQNKKHWSFLDGPITANNPMGVHHAWGRTYKDVFQRYKACRVLTRDFRMVLTARDFGLRWKWKKNSVLKIKKILKNTE